MQKQRKGRIECETSMVKLELGSSMGKRKPGNHTTNTPHARWNCWNVRSGFWITRHRGNEDCGGIQMKYSNSEASSLFDHSAKSAALFKSSKYQVVCGFLPRWSVLCSHSCGTNLLLDLNSKGISSKSWGQQPWEGMYTEEDFFWTPYSCLIASNAASSIGLFCNFVGQNCGSQTNHYDRCNNIFTQSKHELKSRILKQQHQLSMARE